MRDGEGKTTDRGGPDELDEGLISPWGGRLVSLLVAAEEREELRRRANELPSISIGQRAVCDLELLATGAFSPLDRFMGREDYDSVLATMRLSDGRLFPIPISLTVAPHPALALDREIALRDRRNQLLATMTVEEIFGWRHGEAAERVCGTLDPRHPLVAEMFRWGPLMISGPLQVLDLPRHHDFESLRLTPVQVRRRLGALGARNVVAFQTRNPLHRVHEELTKRACADVDGTLLLHPAVGMTKPGDVDHYTRVRATQVLVERYYDARRTLLALLPLAMRMAGPREALWHAIIRRNYGVTHLIVGRDHASPGVDSRGQPFYGPFDAQALMSEHEEEIGVTVVPFKTFVYLPDEDRYVAAEEAPPGARTASISGTEVRERYLDAGRRLPPWFTRPEVARVLAETYPPRHRQGLCCWLTGLTGAGKTVTADILATLLLEHGRQVTVLDGKVVRAHLSKGLTWSKEDRDVNVRRIGFVATQVVRHGGLAICAAESPYRAARDEVRNMVGADRFVEVHVDADPVACQRRDTTGLYTRARRGEVVGVTGVDAPYEAPLSPEIRIDAERTAPEERARIILDYLIERGVVRAGLEWGLTDGGDPSDGLDYEI